MKLAIQWVMNPDSKAVANAYGYAAYNRAMYAEALKYFNITPDAPVAVHLCPADHFKPIDGKANILATMWECRPIPETYREALAKADAVLVPCQFCKEVFEDEGCKTPIYVVPLGINPDRFQFHQRRFPNHALGEKFRFLWVGAPNPRKGWELVVEAAKVISQFPHMELFLKTTAPDIDAKRLEELYASAEFQKELDGEAGQHRREQFEKRKAANAFIGKEVRFGKYGNIIFDSRNYPSADLIALYRSAHVFVLPTFGEGWGLTLCEAMATGAPCISGSWTGQKEFFDRSVGLEIERGFTKVPMLNYKMTGRWYSPNVNSMIDRMVDAYRDYKTALRLGRRASERVRTLFTWARAGQKFADTLNAIIPTLTSRKAA